MNIKTELYHKSIEVLSGLTGAADVYLKKYFRLHKNLGQNDRKNISEIVYGVIRTRAYIDELIKESGFFINKEPLLSELRVSVYFWKLNKKVLFKNHSELIEKISTVNEDSFPAHIKLNFPQYMEEDLKQSFGKDFNEEIAALNEKADMDLRVNTLKTTKENAIKILFEEGVNASPTLLSPWGLRVIGNKRPNPSNTALKNGYVEVQDEGSQLIAAYSPIKEGMLVTDFCAGAGGKTLALAAKMNNKGRIYATDISKQKISTAKLRLRRAGVTNTTCVVLNQKWVKRHKQFFNCVLVDAPCSGSGTWRRNPDLKWRSINWIELLEQQRRILDQAQELVKVGGILIYSTCSVLKKENEDQVNHFLQRHSCFKITSANEIWQRELKSSCPFKGDFMSLTPYRHKTDGFFLALLTRY